MSGNKWGRSAVKGIIEAILVWNSFRGGIEYVKHQRFPVLESIFVNLEVSETEVIQLQLRLLLGLEHFCVRNIMVNFRLSNIFKGWGRKQKIKDIEEIGRAHV